MATPKADEVSVLNGLAQLPTSGVGADSIRLLKTCFTHQSWLVEQRPALLFAQYPNKTLRYPTTKANTNTSTATTSKKTLKDTYNHMQLFITGIHRLVDYIKSLQTTPTSSPELFDVLELLRRIAESQRPRQFIVQLRSDIIDILCSKLEEINGCDTLQDKEKETKCVMETIQILTQNINIQPTSSVQSCISSLRKLIMETPNNSLLLSTFGSYCHSSSDIQKYVKSLDKISQFYRVLIRNLSDQNLNVVSYSLKILTVLVMDDSLGDKLFNEINITQTWKLIFNLMRNNESPNMMDTAVQLLEKLLVNSRFRVFLESDEQLEVCLRQVMDTFKTAIKSMDGQKPGNLVRTSAIVNPILRLFLTLLQNRINTALVMDTITECQLITNAFKWVKLIVANEEVDQQTIFGFEVVCSILRETVTLEIEYITAQSSLSTPPALSLNPEIETGITRLVDYINATLPTLRKTATRDVSVQKFWRLYESLHTIHHLLSKSNHPLLSPKAYSHVPSSKLQAFAQPSGFVEDRLFLDMVMDACRGNWEEWGKFLRSKMDDERLRNPVVRDMVVMVAAIVALLEEMQLVEMSRFKSALSQLCNQPHFYEMIYSITLDHVDAEFPIRSSALLQTYLFKNNESGLHLWINAVQKLNTEVAMASFQLQLQSHLQPPNPSMPRSDSKLDVLVAPSSSPPQPQADQSRIQANTSILKDSIFDTSARIEEADRSLEAIQRLEEEMACMHDRFTKEMEMKNALVESKIMAYESKLDALKMENAHMKELIDSQTESIQELESTVAKKSEKEHQLLDLVATIKASSKDSRARIQSLEKELGDSKLALSAKEDVYRSAVEKCKNFEEELKRMKERFKNTVRDMEEAYEQRDSLERELKHAVHNYDKIASKHEELNLTYQQLEGEVSKLEEVLATEREYFESQKRELTEYISKLEAELDNHDEVVTTLSAALSGLKKKSSRSVDKVRRRQGMSSRSTAEVSGKEGGSYDDQQRKETDVTELKNMLYSVRI